MLASPVSGDDLSANGDYRTPEFSRAQSGIANPDAGPFAWFIPRATSIGEYLAKIKVKNGLRAGAPFLLDTIITEAAHPFALAKGWREGNSETDGPFPLISLHRNPARSAGQRILQSFVLY